MFDNSARAGMEELAFVGLELLFKRLYFKQGCRKWLNLLKFFNLPVIRGMFQL